MRNGADVCEAYDSSEHTEVIQTRCNCKISVWCGMLQDANDTLGLRVSFGTEQQMRDTIKVPNLNRMFISISKSLVSYTVPKT